MSNRLRNIYLLFKPIVLMMKFGYEKYPLQFFICIIISFSLTLLELISLYLISTAISKAFNATAITSQRLTITVLIISFTALLEYLHFNYIHEVCKKISANTNIFIQNTILKTKSKEYKNYLLSINWRTCKAFYDNYKLSFKSVSPLLFIIFCLSFIAYLNINLFIGIIFCGLILGYVLYKIIFGKNLTTRRVKLQSYIQQRNRDLREGNIPKETFEGAIDLSSVFEKTQIGTSIFYQLMLLFSLLLIVFLSIEIRFNNPFFTILGIFCVRQFINNIRNLVSFAKQYMEDSKFISSYFSIYLNDGELFNLKHLLYNRKNSNKESDFEEEDL